MWNFLKPTVAASLLAGCAITGSFTPPTQAQPGAARGLTPEQVARIGQRIWKNECGGTVAGLTSWNAGEEFASLGIGHFIWYPRGKEGPFEESFPPLVAFLSSRGARLPAWLQSTPDCPWQSREAFAADSQGQRQRDLRTLLSTTIREQTEFIMARSEAALPKMLRATADPALVERSYRALRATPEGSFCLIDYVNFKGEGTNPKERYSGQGWGLLQVLEEMGRSASGGAPWNAQFAEAAKRVLSRRVANSPAARGEKRWLAGWHSRCEAYKGRL